MFDPRSITTELTFKNPYRAPASLELSEPVSQSKSASQGKVRGLLALFVALQIIGAVSAIYAFATGAGAVFWARQQGLISLAATLRTERLLLPVSILATGVGVVAILIRWRHTPAFWQAYLASTACLSAYFGFHLFTVAIQTTDPGLGTGLRMAAAQYSGTVFGSVLWLTYWVRSKRVSARFQTSVTT